MWTCLPSTMDAIMLQDDSLPTGVLCWFLEIYSDDLEDDWLTCSWLAILGEEMLSTENDSVTGSVEALTSDSTGLSMPVTLRHLSIGFFLQKRPEKELAWLSWNAACLYMQASLAGVNAPHPLSPVSDINKVSVPTITDSRKGSFSNLCDLTASTYLIYSRKTEWSRN